MTSAPPPPVRSRLRRWAPRVALGVGAVVLVAAGAVAFLVSSLDSAWLKPRLQAELKTASGLDVDWSGLRLRLGSGLILDDLHVKSPPVLQPEAPDFVSVKHAELEWTLGRLVRGERPYLDRAQLDDVTVTLVTDKQRGSTLDLLFPSGPPPKTPPPPSPGLSRTLADLFGAAPFVTAGVARGVSYRALTVEEGKVVDHTTVSALDLTLDGWKAHLTQAVPGLTVEALGASAQASLTIDAAATGTALTLGATAAVQRQDFEPRLQVQQLLALEGTVALQPKDHRLQATVRSASLADALAAVQATLTYQDDGVATLDTGTVDLDPHGVARLATAFGAPLSLASGTLHLTAQKARLTPDAGLLPEGDVHLAVELAELTQGAPPAQTKAQHVSLTGSLAAAKGAGLSAGLKGTVAALALQGVAVDALSLEAGAVQQQGAWRGTASLRLPHLLAGGAEVNELALALTGSELRKSETGLGVTGALSLTGEAAKVRSGGPTATTLDQAHLTLAATLAPTPPSTATVGLRAHLVVAGPTASYYDGPLEAQVQVTRFHPLERTGALQGSASLGALTLDVKGEKHSAFVRLEGGLEAPSLALVEPFVHLPKGWSVAFAPAGASLHTNVELGALASSAPTITHSTTLDLKNFHAQAPKVAVRVPALRLQVDGKGTAVRHADTLALDCRGCGFGTAAGDERLTGSVDFDRARPSLNLRLDGGGTLGPDLKAAVAVSYAAPQNLTSVDAQLTVSRLASVEPLVEGTPAAHLDWQTLGVGLKVKGTLAGKTPALDTAQGAVSLELKGLTYADQDRSFDVPALTLELRGHAGAVSQLEASLDAAKVVVENGEKTASLGAVGLKASGELRPERGAGHLRATLTVGQAEQDFVPNYPVGGVTLDLLAGRDEAGVVTLQRSTLSNEAAGTSLSVEGALVAEAGRRKATLRAELLQNLALAWRDTKQFQGKGNAVLLAQVFSADLRTFTTTGSLMLDDVDVKVGNTSAEGIKGELPFAVDLLSDAKGVRPARASRVNPYALLRFQDQHPLLKGQSFLTLRSLTTPQATIAPFAANVQLAQTVLYLSQLELGLSGGTVTGEMLVDMGEKDTKVRANVRATGIKSADGELFSGNAALALSLKDHSIDGRAEVLQISRRHLLALLDLQDPHHSSASTNRIRSVLNFGYPDRLHILFNHGFASAKVTFGGPAALVNVDELRGIPVESLVDRYVFSQDDADENEHESEGETVNEAPKPEGT